MRQLAVMGAVLGALAFVVPAAAGPRGAGLFASNCSTCHGATGGGRPGRGPTLHGVGALGADFYVRTGYMPLQSPHVQPERSRVLFTEPQIEALVSYVASLGNGPPIPTPHPAGRVAVGMRLFTSHCAGCHQIVGAGGFVTGARVPPLTHASDRQIAEAIRIGPYLMPRFSKRDLTAADVNALVSYIDYAKHPDDRGGWAIGHLGPWPEGVVAWLVATAALVGVCLLLGRKLRT
jgi:ubiquinol-cytochrome c reductase cytochrome c subunit